VSDYRIQDLKETNERLLQELKGRSLLEGELIAQLEVAQARIEELKQALQMNVKTYTQK